MTRVQWVAWHVFKESVRDRVLYALAAFAVLLVSASVVIGQITAGQDVKIIKDLGLASIELSGVMMAVFIGVSLVAREIERRSIYSLIAKPIHRWEFLIGKYVGLVGTLAVNVALMTAAFYLMLLWLEWTTPDDVRRAWVVPAADPALLKAVVMILAELSLLTAVALLFSTFSSSTLLSVGFTLGVYVAGLFSADLRGLSAVLDSAVIGSVVGFIGTVLPDFSAFDVKADVVHGRPPVTWGYVALTAGYAAIYAGALVGGAVAIFNRREFK